MTGGGAKIAEKFLEEWVIENKLIKQPNLHIYHSGNINISSQNNLIEYKISRSKFFIFDYIKRCLFVKKFKDNRLILNLTNFPIPDFFIPKNLVQSTLIHNAYLLAFPLCYKAPSFKFKLVHHLKRLFFLITVLISKKSYFMVQSHWMQKLTQKSHLHFLFKNEVFIIPIEAHSSNFKNINISNDINMNSKLKPFWFYPAAFHPHKNHEFLIKLAKKLKLNNENIKIVITLSNHDLNSNQFISKIKSFQLDEIIINIGWVNDETILEYFKQSEGLLFLSSFESLGLPLLEAKSLNKKIIAADCDCTKMLLEENCAYIDIFKADTIDKCLTEMKQINSPQSYSNKDPLNIYEGYFKCFVKWKNNLDL